MAGAAEGSYFDGGTLQRIGWNLVGLLLTVVTLGFGFPWAVCMMTRWEVKHTVIDGRRLKFTGHGHQLLGRGLLWGLLTLLTFGIYAFWWGLGVKKWEVKHTVYEDFDPDDDEPSRFTGGALGWLGWHLLFGVIVVFTLGLGTAWAQKMLIKWEAEHTEIGGYALEFDGTGLQLFGRYVGFGLLTMITFGIFAIFVPVRMLKWQVSHTSEGDDEAPDGSSPVWQVALAVVGLIVGGGVLYLLLMFLPFLGLLPLMRPGVSGGVSSQAVFGGLNIGQAAKKVSAEEFGEVLIGDWVSAFRVDYTIYTCGYSFTADGYADFGETLYANSHIDSIAGDPGDEYGWFVPPRGFPYVYGSYSLTALEDNRFAVTISGPEYGTNKPREIVLEINYVDDDTLIIGGRTYVRGPGEFSLEFYAQTFDFSLEWQKTPAEPSRMPVEEMRQFLSGEWSRAYREGNRITIVNYEFLPDGQISFYEQIYGNVLTEPLAGETGDDNGWYLLPMGYPPTVGTYSLTPDDSGFNRFTLTIDAVQTWDNQPVHIVSQLSYIWGSNSIQMDEKYPGRGIGFYTLPEYAALNGFSLAPLPPEVAEIEQLLQGRWSYAYRDGDYIFIRGYDFSEWQNIRVRIGGSHLYYDQAQGQNVWGPLDMGLPRIRGSYSLTPLGDGRFTLDINAGDLYGSYQETLEIAYDRDNNTLSVDGQTYLPGMISSLDEYGQLFGFEVDPSIPIDDLTLHQWVIQDT